jgi:putrescine transport system ATP-binding protein
MVLSERIGVMDKGRLVQVDTPRRVYERPKNRFIADFIGTVNLLEAKLAGPVTAPGPVTVEVPALGGTVAAMCDQPPAAGRPVWLAIRPEMVTVSPDLAALPRRGKVTEYAYFGDMTEFRLRVAGSDAMIRAVRSNSLRSPATEIGWGMEVSFDFPAQSALVLGE